MTGRLRHTPTPNEWKGTTGVFVRAETVTAVVPREPAGSLSIISGTMSIQHVHEHWNQSFARQLRRAYLDLTIRRARPGTGSSRSFTQRRDWSAPKADIARIQTPFVIIGAVATRLYMSERQTRDIDLYIEERSRLSLERELSALGFKMVDRISVGESSWISEEQVEVDVLEFNAPWVADAVAQPEHAPDGSPVISLPYLVLLKLNASRGIDLGDLTKMLGLADEVARDRVRVVVQKYQPEDIDDLESLIALGDLEYGASGREHQ